MTNAERALYLTTRRMRVLNRKRAGRPRHRSRFGSVRISCHRRVAKPVTEPAVSQSEFAAPVDAQLSRRELEVVRLVMTGMTNREIADKLFISERTAEGHLERIRGKLGVRSRTEVAMWAAKRGMGAAR